jgi:hypothetical protein
VSLSGRQDEAQRSALTIAAGVQLGREAASRTAKPLGLLIPFFSPTAQWCARTTVLSIMSAVVSRSTTAASVMEAGKRRLAGDTARAATTGEVQDLRREARALKECVVDLTLENRLLKKRMARPVCKGDFEVF